MILGGATKGAAALQTAKSAFSTIKGIFGGDSGPNIARNFSKRIGCQILQKDRPQAEALIARGIDPCTGQPSRTSAVPAPVQSTMARAHTSLAPLRPETLERIGVRTPAERGIMHIPLDVLKTPVPQAGGGGTIGVPPMSLQASMGMSGLPAIRGLVSGGIGLLRTATGRISSIVLPSGQKFSRRKAAALIKKFGLEAGAVALGIGVVEAAEILLADAQAPRRRRGISAAQLSNAKRVNCAIRRMHKDLGLARTAPARRKTTCR